MGDSISGAMRILEGAKRDRFVRALEQRGASDLAEVEPAVRRIVSNVRRNGDRALRRYAARWDGLGSGEPVRVPEADLHDAWERTAPDLREAITQAAGNIRRYCEWQKPQEWRREIHPGVCVGQLVRPLESVGTYVPGGRYPLPSTLLMTVIPAQVAGVKTICVACPRPSAEILGLAAYLNVSHVFRMGGAQAIAALAYGTETVPKVDRVVGPGSVYVAAAKKLIAGETGIDFVAGPTEVVIITADAEPSFLAADMLAQAEHDTEASAILLTTSRTLAEAVAGEIGRQLERLPTAPVARQAILRNSAIVVVDSLDQAVEFSNRLAPEHLVLHDTSLLPAVRHAGSIFLGPSSPEAAGDYCSGPNHVLPTSGAARLRGGLSAADFVKVISVQELTPTALGKLSTVVATLARAEGLEAHARSVEVRTRG